MIKSSEHCLGKMVKFSPVFLTSPFSLSSFLHYRQHHDRFHCPLLDCHPLQNHPLRRCRRPHLRRRHPPRLHSLTVQSKSRSVPDRDPR